MSIEKPNVEPNARYSTIQTCSELGISRSTLGRYCKAGMIPVHYFAANFRPFYYGKDIVKLWLMLA